MLVAVAEDDPDIAHLLESLLSHRGYEVVSTSNGMDALAACRARRPDILLLDRSMPGAIDGLEVLRRVRADPVLAAMPVVLLTGHSGSHQVEAGLAAGASAYLVKPFEVRDLMSVVSSLTTDGDR